MAKLKLVQALGGERKALSKQMRFRVFKRVFERAHAGFFFKERFRETIRHRFMQYLGEEFLIYAMHISCWKVFLDPERTLKYFCGCCWNRIRSENDAS